MSDFDIPLHSAGLNFSKGVINVPLPTPIKSLIGLLLFVVLLVIFIYSLRRLTQR